MCSFAFGARVAAHAQGVEWKKLNEEVMLLYKQGSYDRVVVVAENALQVADQAVWSNQLDVALFHGRALSELVEAVENSKL